MDPGDDELKQVGPKVSQFEETNLDNDLDFTLPPYFMSFSHYTPDWFRNWGLGDPWTKP